MILSTRADPPRFLELPKGSNQSTTFKHFLLHSPLPSPSLPSILPRHGKKPPRLNTKKALRLICWLSIFTLTYWAFQRVPSAANVLERIFDGSPNDETHAPKSTISFPKYATPVVVTDQRGKPRWTVSIPSNLHFPLSASDYSDICLRASDVATQVASSRQNLHKISKLHLNQPDPNYVEIEEAQKRGMLPAKTYVPILQNKQQICAKSMTYVLDATQAGLGDALLGLWLSYGLAKKEDRAFFIDYSGFAYGKFTTLFSKLPPAPQCRPPPWEQRTPCPHHANHLVVDSSTLKWNFGLSFQNEYSTQEIFAMARAGYEALFNMKDEDKQYVKSRLEEQRSLIGDHGILVGVHIRRGDRHPFEFQYQQGYLPPSKYMNPAQELIKGHPNSIVLLASDDADIYHHTEVEGTIRAQDKINLASNRHLNKGGLGWEGGFFKDAFWDIGLPEHAQKQKYVGSPEPSRKKQMFAQAGHTERERNYRSEPTKEALQLREYLGRAYMLDLSVLAGSDEVICGVSSKGCRILAVMMGWDKLHNGHWRNVDGEHGWRALFE